MPPIMADYRDTEPTPTHLPVAAEQMLPARTWSENPVVWIALVVTVFMAVPFLAHWFTSESAVERRSARAVPAAPPAPPALPAASSAAPAVRNAGPGTAAPMAQPVRTDSDPTRQLITKCLDRGRVVYTQTGECTGSVTALPIDTGKNVVGPGKGTAQTTR